MPVLRGRVVTGFGNFSYWIAKLHDHYRRKTGLDLFPGTLNVRLDEEWRLPASGIVRLEKEEYGGTVSVNIVPCTVFGRKAFILRTDRAEFGETDHDRSTLEIATDVKLRDAYSLKDGDEVDVTVEA